MTLKKSYIYEALMALICVSVLAIMVFADRSPQPKANAETNSLAEKAYAPQIYVDHLSGCHYLTTLPPHTALYPRMLHGRHYCDK